MRNALTVAILILIVLAVLLAQPVARFRAALGIVPPGVRLAGIGFEGADAAAVSAALDRTFAEPVAVYYAGQRMILRPQLVGFTVDVPGMLAEARRQGTVPRAALVFVGGLIDRPPRPVDVPLRYTLDRDALDAWLADIAGRYDRPPVPPQSVPARLTVLRGQPGRTLDLAASRDRIIAALTDARTRSADLAVREAMPPEPDMKVLEQLLRGRLADFPGVGGIFLHDVTTGDEVDINGGVAFSGMSTMKIAVVEEAYRKANGLPDPATRRLISETVTLGGFDGNHSADLLLEMIGDGDAGRGVTRLDASLKTLGLKDTFMASPYDPGLGSPSAAAVVTAGNSRKDISTRPDPAMQTTPRDMGLLLDMLVECSQGGGPLIAAYPGQFNAEKCRQALDYLALNDIHDLVTKGVPPGTRVAHKHGYSATTHGDNAVIWGPAGPYVLSVYLYAPDWLEFDLSSRTMTEISQAVWNYYLVVKGK